MAIQDNVTEKIDGETVEGLVEEVGAKTPAGDSGGPWLSLNAKSEVIMEGIAVAEDDYEPIKTPLEQFDLELLTTANENRPPCP